MFLIWVQARQRKASAGFALDKERDMRTKEKSEKC